MERLSGGKVSPISCFNSKHLGAKTRLNRLAKLRVDCQFYVTLNNKLISICNNFDFSMIVYITQLIIIISINLLVVNCESVNLIGHITRRLPADSVQL